MTELERLRAMVLHPDWNMVVSEIANYRRKNACEIAVTGMDHPADMAFLNRRIDSIDWGKGYNNRICANVQRWVWNDDSDKFDCFSLVTVRELVALNEIQIIRCPNVGVRAVERIKSKLAEHGLYLGMQV